MGEALKAGDYQIRADGRVSGRCAGCGLPVTEDQPSVVSYHVSGARRGGIFHAARCDPLPREPGAWYTVTDEAPDV